MALFALGLFATTAFVAGERLSPCSLRGSVACALSRLWGSLLAASAGPSELNLANESRGTATMTGEAGAGHDTRRSTVRTLDDREVEPKKPETLLVSYELPIGYHQLNEEFDGASCRYVQRTPSGQGGHLTVG